MPGFFWACPSDWQTTREPNTISAQILYDGASAPFLHMWECDADNLPLCWTCVKAHLHSIQPNSPDIVWGLYVKTDFHGLWKQLDVLQKKLLIDVEYKPWAENCKSAVSEIFKWLLVKVYLVNLRRCILFINVLKMSLVSSSEVGLFLFLLLPLVYIYIYLFVFFTSIYRRQSSSVN